MRKAALLLGCWFAALITAPGAAVAHPLGNFSINHLSSVRISTDRVDVRYVLDQAEIPTLQERGLSRGEVLRRKRAEVARALVLTVDGRRVALASAGRPGLSFPRGAGGLRTTRLVLPLRARAREARHVRLADHTFAGRIGWKAVVAAAGDGTAVRTRAPSGDPTRGLTRYPRDVLASPRDRREAGFAVSRGQGTLTAPRSEGGRSSTTRAAADGLTGLLDQAASGHRVLVLLLIAACGWGALHALSPGHGKAMVAAYLVGTRGTPRQAVALGVAVTVTHTIGVFALALVTLALSQYVLPEELYPWLALVSGLMVAGLGLVVLRSRLRHARSHAAARRHHQHHHHRQQDDGAAALGRRGILGMGAAAGLIPCPSALVVLLAAISQHELGLGLLLITAFSAGLAATLTLLGLAVVWTRRLLPARLARGPLVAALPTASALVIVVVGCALTLNAMPAVV